jgi:hypothetical protein
MVRIAQSDSGSEDGETAMALLNRQRAPPTRASIT